MVRTGAVNGPWWGLQAQLGQQPLLDTRHERAHGVAFLKPLLEVFGTQQLVIQPALFKCARVAAEFILGSSSLHGFEGSFGA